MNIGVGTSLVFYDGNNSCQRLFLGVAVIDLLFLIILASLFALYYLYTILEHV